MVKIVSFTRANKRATEMLPCSSKAFARFKGQYPNQPLSIQKGQHLDRIHTYDGSETACFTQWDTAKKIRSQELEESDQKHSADTNKDKPVEKDYDKTIELKPPDK